LARQKPEPFPRLSGLVTPGHVTGLPGSSAISPSCFFRAEVRHTAVDETEARNAEMQITFGVSVRIRQD
jgi:hypothetical protein